MNRATYNTPKKSNQVGFCKYHYWLLSWAQVRNYRCLHKKREGSWCPYFRPNLKHSLWGKRKIPEYIRVKLGVVATEQSVSATNCGMRRGDEIDAKSL
ncbi:MAG: hypothetical protein WC364_13505 [Eubacteriales bacterium]|jgi:hypothetical protein